MIAHHPPDSIRAERVAPDAPDPAAAIAWLWHREFGGNPFNYVLLFALAAPPPRRPLLPD